MRFASHAIKFVAGTFDRVRPGPSGLVVLIYHRVGARTGVRVDLPTATFDAQIAELSASGRAIALDDALDRLTAGEDLAGRVVVTFDDGTVDFVDEAVPVLARHGVPATLYVATRHVDEGIDFPDAGRPVSWSGLRDALDSGVVTIGSHTHSHVLLDRLPAEDVADELDRSIELIGAELGVAAAHFAYPKALEPTPFADELVRNRFRSAALAGTQANPVGTDVYRLRRSPIQTTDGLHWFRHKADGGMRLEDEVRQVVNRRRYAEATS
ncbi:MAG: polysaccharide deacetylase family protein [Actinomycetota bacterium]